MSDHPWNDDIAYAFSTHRTLMQVLGTWPLQKMTISTIMLWSLSTVIQLTSYIFLFIEITGNQHNVDASTETMMFFICMIVMVLKHVCITINRKKLAKFMEAAFNDWVCEANNKESYKVMKEQARTSNLLTNFMVYSGTCSASLYIFGVVITNLMQLFSDDMDISNGTISTPADKMFIIPSGDLGDRINDLEYAMVIVIQSIQMVMICLVQTVMDTFYINVTLHLSGQLKLLKAKFETFANEPDTEANHRKKMSSLVGRHCELADRSKNIEDTFHIITLIQLFIVTVCFALIGLRVIVCLRQQKYIEVAKSLLALNYIFMEALIFCYGGDFIQRSSEGILYAMFMSSWITFPAALMKDLHFAMMRSTHALHLTGGKFFYANRETVVYVFKTAASYISVLRMALRD